MPYFALFFALLLGPLYVRAEIHVVSINQEEQEQSLFGTTVFGIGGQNANSGIWPCNFWSNFNPRDFADELHQLKLEGANAAIILYPYVDEANSETRLKQLKTIFELGNVHGIKITLRLGFAYDHGHSSLVQHRQVGILVNSKLREGWYRFCQQTYDLASKYYSFSGAFICWEDFWDFFHGAGLNQAQRKVWAKYINYHQEIVPSRGEPLMEEYFDYFNDVFTLDFFTATQRIFPNLGMEVRLDYDPIYKDGEFLKYYIHKKQFSAPNLKKVYLYWGPYLGAINEGDQISAEMAVRLLVVALERAQTLSSPEAKFIISQFNYRDNSPGHNRNTRIIPEELDEFILKSAPILRHYCDGVYTWSNYSYRHNAINNGTFSMGSKFWSFSHALVGIEDNRIYLSAYPGGSITQYFDPDAPAILQDGTKARLEFSAKSMANTICVASLGGQSHIITLIGDGQWNTYSAEFPITDVAGQQLILSFPQGAHIDDVVLSNHTQMMGPHDSNYVRDITYANLAWAITKNQEYSTRFSVVAGVAHDNWIASRAIFMAPAKDGRYQLTIDLNIPQTIPQQTIYITLRNSNSTATCLTLKPGNHRLLVSGKSADANILLSVAFSQIQKPTLGGPDLRLVAARLNSISEK
jgi:hypothetical protein